MIMLQKVNIDEKWLLFSTTDCVFCYSWHYFLCRVQSRRRIARYWGQGRAGGDFSGETFSKFLCLIIIWLIFQRDAASKSSLPRRGEYNVYSTFQSHEPEFDYLKSLEIEEKINKIRWLRRKNPAHFLLSTNGIKTITFLAAKTCDKILFLDKTIKLWKVSERDKRAEGYNLKEDSGVIRDPSSITTLKVPVLKPMELMVEASMFDWDFLKSRMNNWKLFQVPEGYLPTLTLITLTPSLSILIRQDSRINKHDIKT